MNNMKRYINWIACVLIFFTGLSLTACSNDDLDTNQYNGSTHLNVFGPCPVARGGELRFLGVGLDNITKITLPGNEDITDINQISSEEIRITVPQDAQTGYVTLTNKDGGTITTKTPLTFSEPISIDAISPLTVKPGEEITITGDYLNLIHSVIFEDGIEDSTFISQSRKEIKIAVPKDAQTGRIILSDGASPIPNWVYSDDTLTVSTTTFKSLGTKTVKPGQTLAINGENMKWIKSVKFGSTEVSDFTVNDDSTEIDVTIPKTVASSRVTLVSLSGVEIDADSITTIIPTNLKVIPTEVKNGEALTITGNDMDMVTSVTFPNSDAVTPTTIEEGKIIVSVPVTAQDGDITLNLENGQTVTVSYTTQKADITAFDPTSAPQGSSVSMAGNNLDLVKSVIFNGMTTETVTNYDKTTGTLSCLVPIGATTGNVTIILNNGSKLTSTASLTVTAPLGPTIISATDAAAGGTISINGSSLDNIKFFYLGNMEYKLTTTMQRSDQVTATLPDDVPLGEYAITMIDNDGNIIKSSVKATVVPKEYTIWEGSTKISGWAAPQVLVDRTTPTDISKLSITAGSSVLKVTYTTKDMSSWFNLQLNNANWTTWGEIKPNNEAINGAASYGTVTYEIPMTQTIIDAFNVNDGWSNHCMIIQGEGDATVTKIAIQP